MQEKAKESDKAAAEKMAAIAAEAGYVPHDLPGELIADPNSTANMNSSFSVDYDVSLFSTLRAENDYMAKLDNDSKIIPMTKLDLPNSSTTAAAVISPPSRNGNVRPVLISMESSSVHMDRVYSIESTFQQDRSTIS